MSGIEALLNKSPEQHHSLGLHPGKDFIESQQYLDDDQDHDVPLDTQAAFVLHQI